MADEGVAGAVERAGGSVARDEGHAERSAEATQARSRQVGW